MNKQKYIIISANLLVLIIVALIHIFKSEQIISTGQDIYLKLAPKDPRSIMQGDYMTLNMDINNKIRTYIHEETNFFEGDYSDWRKEKTKELCLLQYVVISKDSSNVVRLQDNIKPKSENEVIIRLSHEDKYPIVPIKSFFFEEGSGDKYSDAQYAHVKVDLLGYFKVIALADKNKEDIK